MTHSVKETKQQKDRGRGDRNGFHKICKMGVSNIGGLHKIEGLGAPCQL